MKKCLFFALIFALSSNGYSHTNISFGELKNQKNPQKSAKKIGYSYTAANLSPLIGPESYIDCLQRVVRTDSDVAECDKGWNIGMPNRNPIWEPEKHWVAYGYLLGAARAIEKNGEWKDVSIGIYDAIRSVVSEIDGDWQEKKAYIRRLFIAYYDRYRWERDFRSQYIISLDLVIYIYERGIK